MLPAVAADLDTPGAIRRAAPRCGGSPATLSDVAGAAATGHANAAEVATSAGPGGPHACAAGGIESPATAVEGRFHGPASGVEAAPIGGEATAHLARAAGRTLPIFAHVGALEVAVVNAEVYRALVRKAGVEVKVQATPRLSDDRPWRMTSTIERDVEVAAFLRERFPLRMTVAQLHAACVARFGAGRAPSGPRIGTFRKRVTG